MKKLFFCFLFYIACISCSQPSNNNTATVDTTAAKSNLTEPVQDTAWPAGPVPNTIMTEAYVKNLATSIYGWGWPMANIYNRVLTFRPLPSAMYAGVVLPVSPPN